MRYIGSKASTLPTLAGLITDLEPTGSFCDPFGGVGVVGAHFKSLGYAVHSGDNLLFPHQFQLARVALDDPPKVSRTLHQLMGASSPHQVSEYLNLLTPVTSWITRYYSHQRPFFTISNARKADAIRIQLEKWTRSGAVTAVEAAFYTASLISSMDRVANTAGTYYAALKDWSRKARQPLRFELLAPVAGLNRCTASNVDAAVLARSKPWDILYLDPPYNSRDYAAYYHLPETIALQQRPQPSGISGVSRRERPLSRFGRRESAARALHDLVDTAQFRLLVFHYSDTGTIAPAECSEILRAYGHVSTIRINAIGYSSVGKRETSHTIYIVKP